MEAVNVVSSRDEWLPARLALLEKEKEFTRAKDALAAERRKLPLVKVTKDYKFTVLDPSTGKEKTVGLADLFEGKTQLLVYHFMFKPDWENGCHGCSFLADHFPHPEYINSRDTTLAVVSLAPPAKLEAYAKRFGWDNFRWYSSGASDFNIDYFVSLDGDRVPLEYNFRSGEEWAKKGQADNIKAGSEQPGMSVFVKGKDGEIYHSYSCYGRQTDWLLTTNELLDLTPLGRQDPSKGISFSRRC